MASNYSESCGDWNEAGLIRGLDRKGFTPNKCGSELIANSCDAGAKNITFMVNENNYIKLIDDGNGMIKSKLQEMFSMFKSNNAERISMGVSGLGGKEALYIYSKSNKGLPSTVTIYTHANRSPYLKAIVPWDKITTDLQYEGQIKISSMTDEEIKEFRSERNIETGTTIKWNYSEIVDNTIKEQFELVNYDVSMCLKNRWGIIFGDKPDINIVYNNITNNIIKSLKLYNYFNGKLDDYFMNEITQHNILHYVDNNKKNHYVYNGYECFTNVAGQVLSEPKKCDTNDWKCIGTYYLEFALRKNSDNNYIYNEVEGDWIRNSKGERRGDVYLCDYDDNFFKFNKNKDIMREELSKLMLYRNNQFITYFDLWDFKSGSARADGIKMYEIFHIRSRIYYHTESTQDNIMDIAMGIQENKNQNQDDFPRSLNKLVCYLKKQYITKLTKHFSNISNNKKTELLSSSDNDDSSNNDSENEDIYDEDINELINKVNKDNYTKFEINLIEFEEQEKEVNEEVEEEIVEVEEEEVKQVKEEIAEVKVEIAEVKEEEVKVEEVKEETVIINKFDDNDNDNKQIRLTKIVQYLLSIQVGDIKMLDDDVLTLIENKLFTV